MGLLSLCWSNFPRPKSVPSGLGSYSVLKFKGPGGGGLQSPGTSSRPVGPLGLHHLRHVSHQQAEDQRVDQHTDLGGLALSVGYVVADQRDHAGQVVGHGVGNKEEEDEASSLGHLVLYTVKKFSRLY